MVDTLLFCLSLNKKPQEHYYFFYLSTHSDKENPTKEK